MKKKRAGIEYLGSIMLICLTGILLLFCYDYRNVRLCQMKLKDSVDISALAGAIVDKDEFEQTGKLVIKDVSLSRKIFEDTLKYNLELDDNMTPDETKNYETITIHKFIVYHVVNDEYIIKYDVNSDYQYESQQLSYDNTQKSPDGKIIEGETIYVEIGTNIKGILNKKNYQYISSCVDIVSSVTEGE